MKVLKWVLIVFGSLVLVLVTGMVGVFIWASTVETVELTAADFEVGGTYPAEERNALFDACKGNWLNKNLDEAACTCIADKAATESSRYMRLMLVAVYENSPTKITALAKGLANSGVPPTKIYETTANPRQRTVSLMRYCSHER